MPDILTTLLGVAWKLALTLTAIKCTHSVVQYVSARRQQPPRFRSPAKGEPRSPVDIDEARRSVALLQAQLQQESERSQLEAERLYQEVGFWRGMEALARQEIGRKDELFGVQKDRIRSLERQLRESEMIALERVGAAEKERLDMQAMLDAARQELLDIQGAFTPEDAYSDVDVVQIVRNLNVEISRTATLLTDAFHAEEHRSGEGFAVAYERTKEAVGPIMAELLESIHHQDDPILVHIALQADMVAFAAGIISAWDFQHQSNAVFSGIHKQMLKSEPQSVAGRWRALTRQYSKQRLYNGRDLAEGFTNQLYDRLYNILAVSGARVMSDQLRRSLHANLQLIIRLALELQEVVGEQVTSHDLEIVVVRVDEVFDSMQMEDIYGREGLTDEAHEQLHVLCTAALGLRRCEKPKDGLGDELQLSTLVKPKVVLETLVFELGLVDEDSADE